jgi:phosphomethylpyrimidine synthase
MLCYVTTEEYYALPDKHNVKTADIAHKDGADLVKGHLGTQYRDNALSKASLEFHSEEQFSLFHDPVTRRGFHDEALRQEGAKSVHFYSMCGPHFCSMKLTEVLRKYPAEQAISAENGLARDKSEKSKDFVEAGAGVCSKE